MDRDDFTGHSIDDLERAYATDSERKGPNRISDHPHNYSHTQTHIHAITYGSSTDTRMKGYGRIRPLTRHTKVTALFDYRDNGTGTMAREQTGGDSLNDDSAQIEGMRLVE